jgi:hypothetical protein
MYTLSKELLALYSGYLLEMSFLETALLLFVFFLSLPVPFFYLACLGF